MAAILMVCTANQCRSPVAEGLLRQRIDAFGDGLQVGSAGIMQGGVGAPPEMVRAAHAFGLDLAHHRSQAIDWTTLDETELIITMMRRHVREVVVHDVGSWSKTFTFRELVRRGRVVGARGSEESLADWVAKVHEGRMVTAMMGDDPSDDVADPMGGNPDDFDATVEILYGLVHELTDLVWPAMPS